MGFSRKRLNRKGKPRYTAYYVDVKGRDGNARWGRSLPRVKRTPHGRRLKLTLLEGGSATVHEAG